MSKVLAIGDVHQKEWILDKASRIADQYDHVVFCGDYLDNFGSSSADRVIMVKRLIEFTKAVPNATLLCGNHDLCYYDKNYSGLYTGWDSTSQLLFDFEPQLKDWLGGLPHTTEIDGVIYSHAGLTDDWTPDRDPLAPDGHMWVRPHDGYVYKPYQVFGHTPGTTCREVQKNVWCIDSFSQHRDGSHMGDCTVLEVVDGKNFNKIAL